MTLIYSFVVIFVAVFIVGCIEAVHINKKMKDSSEEPENTPTIIIGEKVPDPFDSFKKKD